MPHDFGEGGPPQFAFARRVLVGRLVPGSLDLEATVDSLLDGVQQVIVAEWLREELYGPGFHGAYRHRDVAMAGDEDNGKVSLDLGQFLLEIKTTPARELDVEHQAARGLWPAASQELLG